MLHTVSNKVPFVYMRILSNAFPTNMPASEHVSQGGPANFARYFVQYLLNENAGHEWVGVMLNQGNGSTARIEKVFADSFRRYFSLRVPKGSYKRVTQAEHQVDPKEVLAISIVRLAKFIREMKPDIVFLNGFGFLNWMLMIAAKEVGVPCVIQHAGIWTKELDLHKEKYSASGLVAMKAMEAESSLLTAAEIFLNSWSRDFYRANVAVGDSDRTVVIPLPFDFASFASMVSPAPLKTTAVDCRIGVIGRWDKIKNHEFILELAKASRANQEGVTFHSIVKIPDADATGREYVKYVEVTPSADREGILRFCRSMDILYLPSLFDVSPTVVLEAVASGTPVAISPTVGYVHDYHEYGAKEWIIDSSNANQTVKKLRLLKGKNMPKQFQEHIIATHDHRRVFGRYLELFKEKIQKHKKSLAVSRRST